MAKKKGKKPSKKKSTKKAAKKKTTKKKPPKKKTAKKKKKGGKKKAAKKKKPTKKKTAKKKKKSGKKKAAKKKSGKAKSKKKGKESGKTKSISKAKKEEAEVKLKDIVKKLDRLEEKLKDIDSQMRAKAKANDIMMASLGITEKSRKGSKTLLDDLNSSMIQLEEYLITTNKRIDNILSAIKNHREFLVKLNKKVYRVDVKEKMRTELAVMNNTLSLLAINGYNVDRGLFKEVKNLKEQLGKPDIELHKLKKKKQTLDERFNSEMEKFDFESMFSKQKDIPGYR